MERRAAQGRASDRGSACGAGSAGRTKPVVSGVSWSRHGSRNTAPTWPGRQDGAGAAGRGGSTGAARRQVRPRAAASGQGGLAGVDLYQTVFEVIDMRSFSNLWFWIALAVLWSSASHWVLGVPYDMVTRARRHGGEAADDLDAITRINARRMLYIAREAGLWLAGAIAFVLCSLTILAIWYGVEFAQAVLLLTAPMTLVGALALRTARRIEGSDARGPDLWRALLRHRLAVQGIGMVAIVVTSMWGMWQNLNLSAF